MLTIVSTNTRTCHSDSEISQQTETVIIPHQNKDQNKIVTTRKYKQSHNIHTIDEGITKDHDTVQR